ncbi:hypothetical protein M885DRAFT_570290 [Pelagophyceae sp. CCMP2097]|nr:hypothetical protein M885DRAFT_570290 [Pelagophyceae sp. CCMP2097]
MEAAGAGGPRVTLLPCGHVACSPWAARACMNSATAANSRCGASFDYVDIDDAALVVARTITAYFVKARHAKRVLVTVSRMLDGKVSAVTGNIEAARMARQLGAELRQRILEPAGRGGGVRRDAALAAVQEALTKLVALRQGSGIPAVDPTEARALESTTAAATAEYGDMIMLPGDPRDLNNNASVEFYMRSAMIRARVLPYIGPDVVQDGKTSRSGVDELLPRRPPSSCFARRSARDLAAPKVTGGGFS